MNRTRNRNTCDADYYYGANRVDQIGIAFCIASLPLAVFAAALMDIAVLVKKGWDCEHNHEVPHPAFCPAGTPDEEAWAFTQEQDALDEAAVESAYDKYVAAKK